MGHPLVRCGEGSPKVTVSWRTSCGCVQGSVQEIRVASACVGRKTMGEAFRRFALYQGTTFGLRKTQLDHVFKATKASPVHHGKCSDGNVSSRRPLMRLLARPVLGKLRSCEHALKV